MFTIVADEERLEVNGDTPIPMKNSLGMRVIRFLGVFKDYLLYWNKDKNVLLNLLWVFLRWLFAGWILILFLTTSALIIAFLMEPSGFLDSPDNSKDCQVIERSDGTWFDSCDLLEP